MVFQFNSKFKNSLLLKYKKSRNTHSNTDLKMSMTGSLMFPCCSFRGLVHRHRCEDMDSAVATFHEGLSRQYD